MLSYPSLEFQTNLGRSTLPIRALAFSPKGDLLAAAGDAEGIKLHSSNDGTVRGGQSRCTLAWQMRGMDASLGRENTRMVDG